MKLREAKKGQGDRSLPRPVGETGGRSVGNRKQYRLRHDYASFPDRSPLQGSGAAPLSRAWGGSPNVPMRSQKTQTGAEPKATIPADAAPLEAALTSTVSLKTSQNKRSPGTSVRRRGFVPV